MSACQDSQPACCGDPKTPNFCYEFWERVSIDKGEVHLTLADESAAEEQAKLQSQQILCSICKHRK